MKFVLIFSLVAGAIFADEPLHLELGKAHRLLGDKVRVRAKPDTKSAVLAELAIGTEVNPTAQAVEKHTQDGVEAPWYKVSFSKDGKKSEGYVWGNLIAKGHAVSKDGLIFLYGVGKGKKEEGGYESFNSQVRIAKDNKELARGVFDEGTGFATRVNVQLTGGRGFSGVQNILAVQFQQEFCGGKGNTMYIFWDGSKLSKVHSTIDGADAPVYAIETLTFPDDKGGKKDELLLTQETGDHDNPKAKRIEKVRLRWDGKKFIKAS